MSLIDKAQARAQEQIHKAATKAAKNEELEREYAEAIEDVEHRIRMFGTPISEDSDMELLEATREALSEMHRQDLGYEEAENSYRMRGSEDAEV